MTTRGTNRAAPKAKSRARTRPPVDLLASLRQLADEAAAQAAQAPDNRATVALARTLDVLRTEFWSAVTAPQFPDPERSLKRFERLSAKVVIQHGLHGGSPTHVKTRAEALRGVRKMIVSVIRAQALPLKAGEPAPTKESRRELIAHLIAAFIRSTLPALNSRYETLQPLLVHTVKAVESSKDALTLDPADATRLIERSLEVAGMPAEKAHKMTAGLRKATSRRSGDRSRGGHHES